MQLVCWSTEVSSFSLPALLCTLVWVPMRPFIDFLSDRNINKEIRLINQAPSNLNFILFEIIVTDSWTGVVDCT